ncbi:MAG: DUF805 domain-containing protein [Desulfovibrio sp.]|nr:DUF805 domain-containing protein [Desulfovibrio sp.]
MDFKTAVRTCLFQKYCNFRGRAQRSEFWWFVLFGAIVNSFLGLFSNASPDTGLLTSGIVTLILLLPHLAVTARRLHDANLSGWIQLAPMGLAALGGLALHLDFGTSAYMCIMLAGLSGLGLLVLYARRGTVGPNQFGPDPLGGETPAADAPPAEAPGNNASAGTGSGDNSDSGWAKLASKPAGGRAGGKDASNVRPGQRAVPDKRD